MWVPGVKASVCVCLTVVCNLQGSQPQGPGGRRASRRYGSRSFRRRPPPHRPIYYSEVINQLERVIILSVASLRLHHFTEFSDFLAYFSEKSRTRTAEVFDVRAPSSLAGHPRPLLGYYLALFDHFMATSWPHFDHFLANPWLLFDHPDQSVVRCTALPDFSLVKV